MRVRGDLSYEEDITAAYAMFEHNGDSHAISGGLRYEMTDWDSVGVNNSDNNSLVFRSGDYNNLLLSVVGHYNLSNGLRLRYGFNQSLGRPDPGQLARRETVSEEPGTVRVSRGNPDLEPREADNYDLALEYSFGEGEFFAAGYFYKDLTNEIFTLVNEFDTVDSTGAQAILIATEPTNISDTSVQGIEITFVNDHFESLPSPFNGFGITTNFTWLDADLDLPMDRNDPSVTRNVSLLNNSPRWKVNAALLFGKGPLQSRLTLAHRDDQRAVTSTGNIGDDLFEHEYTQWDFFARYAVSDRWSIFTEGRNITNEVRVFKYENGLHKESNEFGRSWWVGVSYQL